MLITQVLWCRFSSIYVTVRDSVMVLVRRQKNVADVKV